MENQQKDVKVELKTTINDNGEIERNKTEQTGKLYQKNNIDVLTFEEEIDEFTIKNMITIYSDKVSIKRTGPLSMHQKFRVEQLTENVYQHPHGNIHMETYTSNLDYQPLTNKGDGLLAIDYTVNLNGQEERKHQLTLSFTEEAPQ